MLSRMVGCETSSQVWAKLDSYFASQIKSHVIQLKTQLRNHKESTQSISEYLLKLKKIIDSLFCVGFALLEADHVEAILEGLSEDIIHHLLFQ